MLPRPVVISAPPSPFNFNAEGKPRVIAYGVGIVIMNALFLWFGLFLLFLAALFQEVFPLRLMFLFLNNPNILRVKFFRLAMFPFLRYSNAIHPEIKAALLACKRQKLPDEVEKYKALSDEFLDKHEKFQTVWKKYNDARSAKQISEIEKKAGIKISSITTHK
ncbi:MAG: hypothetical protein HY936_08475 [Nitrosomonadales bacterium]|nr:hypothetical protein [Nitrosomonadales bacterium]